MFFIYFEKVAMKKKEPKNYSIEIISYLDGPGFELFYQKISIDGFLNTERTDFNSTKDSFS